MKKYIISGGPCAGKTTLLHELANLGFMTLPESARELIAAEQGKSNGSRILPWTDIGQFQQKVMEHQVEMERIVHYERALFLDRSLIDGIAYCRMANISGPYSLQEKIKEARYTKVFFLSQLPYRKDTERIESPDSASCIHRELRHVYSESGLDVLDIRCESLEERIGVVIAEVKKEGIVPPCYPLEETFCMIKPEGLKLQAEIERRLECIGMKINERRKARLTKDEFEIIYGMAAGFPHYVLSRHMIGNSVILYKVSGHDAINRVQILRGASNPALALPGTIRGDYAKDQDYRVLGKAGKVALNIFHAADRCEAAAVLKHIFGRTEEMIGPMAQYAKNGEEK